MRHFDDPICVPGTGAGPEEHLVRAIDLVDTPAQAYVERRGVPVDVADAAGVRFDADFGGRPAVLVAMRDRNDMLASVHGRYLNTARRRTRCSPSVRSVW